MADAVNPLSSLYPQPPQASGNLLTGDPSKVVGVLNALNTNALQQQQIRANTGVENLYKGEAIGPDGQPNHSVLMGRLPTLGIKGPEIATTLLSQQGQGIENTGAQFKQAAGMFGALADAENPTSDMVHQVTAAVAAMFPGVPANVKSSMATAILKDPAGIKHGAAMLKNMAIGPAGTSARVTAPPGPSGAPREMTLGAANIAGATETGLPPGEGGVAEESAARASKLQASAGTTAQYHADLDNLKQDSKILDNLGGPTFETEKKLNQLSQRLGGFGVTMSADQLKAGESFDKIANQISLNQSQLFHGSDAGLHTVVGANPSSSMSRYGREGVIDMLQGNQDAIDTTRKAWMDARARGIPANQYDSFIHEFSKSLDPRVFQFNRLNRENQQKFLSQMDPSEVGDFEQKYRDAIQRKWVKPLKGASGG